MYTCIPATYPEPMLEPAVAVSNKASFVAWHPSQGSGLFKHVKQRTLQKRIGFMGQRKGR
jgi:hypothetical protein